MNQVIWKITLELVDMQSIDVPYDAELLCAREQHDQVCIWFRCDPNSAKLGRRIAIVGTGHPAPINGRYLGTASLRNGSLMLHVFEL